MSSTYIEIREKEPNRTLSFFCAKNELQLFII